MTSRFEKFSERARRVWSLAQEEARRLNHNYIGTEHILLGLIRETDCVAVKVLCNLGVELSKVRSAVEFIIGRGEKSTAGETGLTSQTKKVIELAVDEARRLNHHYIGTEHLLIGLMREGEGVAAGVLESLGVNLDKVRAETTRRALPPAKDTKSAPSSTITDTPETNPGAQRPPAIRVEGLGKAFGRTPVLRGLSLEVPWGEALSVVGPNGAGKTTLIRVLAGLTKPDDGSVEIAGMPLDRMGRLARRVVGAVTHEPLLYDGLTVRENLRFAGRMFSLDRLDGRAESAADRLGVWPRLDDRVGTLSHGLRKRVSIARALLHEPSILLMDEPETGLDRDALSLLESVLGEMTGSGGAVLMTTHSLSPPVSGRRLSIVAGRAAGEDPAVPPPRREP